LICKIHANSIKNINEKVFFLLKRAIFQELNKKWGDFRSFDEVLNRYSDEKPGEMMMLMENLGVK